MDKQNLAIHTTRVVDFKPIHPATYLCIQLAYSFTILQNTRPARQITTDTTPLSSTKAALSHPYQDAWATAPGHYLAQLDQNNSIRWLPIHQIST